MTWFAQRHASRTKAGAACFILNMMQHLPHSTHMHIQKRERLTLRCQRREQLVQQCNEATSQTRWAMPHIWHTVQLPPAMPQAMLPQDKHAKLVALGYTATAVPPSSLQCIMHMLSGRSHAKRCSRQKQSVCAADITCIYTIGLTGDGGARLLVSESNMALMLNH